MMSTPTAVCDHLLAGPALRAFAEIAKAWSLTEMEQSAVLGRPEDVAISTLNGGDNGHLPLETLERLSYVLGIYRALHTIFPNGQQADQWVRRPNTAAVFQGSSALAVMCSGRLEDLASVRQYLDAQGLVNP